MNIYIYMCVHIYYIYTHCYRCQGGQILLPVEGLSILSGVLYICLHFQQQLEYQVYSGTRPIFLVAAMAQFAVFLLTSTGCLARHRE